MFGVSVVRDGGKTVENCCRCEKCIRTMATLDMCNRLQRYGVFPRPLRHMDIWRCWYGYPGSRIFAWQILREAWRNGRIGLFLSFGVAVMRSLAMLPLFTLARWVHRRLKKRSPAYAEFVSGSYRQLWIKLEK